MLKVSTQTQLITFFLFALLLNGWHLYILLLLMSLLLMILIYLRNQHFFRLMYRLKWFYLVTFILFALNTPGEYIAVWPFSLRPTYEGVSMGLEQAVRIATMLALLSLILTHNTQQQLISAIYFMLQPLSSIGLDIERFATRLWLTLHYVELQQSSPKKPSLKDGFSQYLKNTIVSTENEDVAIVLENQRQIMADYLVLSVMGFGFILVCLGWVG